MLGAAVLFGTTGTAAALGPAGATPFTIGTLRIVIGAVALWCSARQRPSPSQLRRHLGLFALGAIGVAAYQPTFFTGTARCGVALGTIVALGSGPLFTGIIEWLWIRRVPAATWWLATTVTIAGGALLVLAGGDAGTVGVADPLGVLGALGAGLSYAVYAVAAGRLIRLGVHSTVALAWPFTIGAVLLLPGLIGRPLDWVLQWRGVLMLAELGLATVGLAYSLYGYGLRTLEPSTAVTLTLAEPLTAAVLGVIVLGEHLQPFGWLGAALVVAGLALAGGVFDRYRS